MNYVLRQYLGKNADGKASYRTVGWAQTKKGSDGKERDQVSISVKSIREALDSLPEGTDYIYATCYENDSRPAGEYKKARPVAASEAPF